MICIDDKHRLKVREPGLPVAAAERGRRVLVRVGTTFEVGDHDFTKFSIIPSVVLVVDIRITSRSRGTGGRCMLATKMQLLTHPPP